MVFKHKPRPRLNLLKPDVSSSLRKAADKMISTRPGGKARGFEVGDRVIARSFSGGEKWVAGTVAEKTGPVSYKVKINGGQLRRHVDQMKLDNRTRDVPSHVDFEVAAPHLDYPPRQAEGPVGDELQAPVSGGELSEEAVPEEVPEEDRAISTPESSRGMQGRHPWWRGRRGRRA